MRQKLANVILCISCALLCLTGTAKIWSAFATGKSAVLLANRDPLIGISNKTLMILVGGIEIGIVLAAVVFRNRKWLPSVAIAMLGSQILVYRYFFAIEGLSRGCPCLGTLGARIPISEPVLSKLLVGVACWFLIGGTAAFIVSYPWTNHNTAESRRRKPTM